MDLDKVAGLVPVVDESAVMDEVDGFVRGWQPAPAGLLDAPRGTLESPRWQITSVGAADWALRKLAEIEARSHEYAEEVSRWQAALDRIRKAGEFFDGHLKQWAISQRTPAVKSFPLASGTVATRETPAGVEVVNEPLAVAWAKLRKPGAVKHVESFLVKESGAKVVEMIVGFDVTDKTTGETDHIELAPPAATDQLDRLVEKIPGEMLVVACYDLRVMVDGDEVPGCAVRAAKITATVTPFHP